jgi:hypothetical protein
LSFTPASLECSSLSSFSSQSLIPSFATSHSALSLSSFAPTARTSPRCPGYPHLISASTIDIWAWFLEVSSLSLFLRYLDIELVSQLNSNQQSVSRIHSDLSNRQIITMAFQPYTPKPITDIFTNDTDINRRECRRVVPMRVLALGLGRTGTACKSQYHITSIKCDRELTMRHSPPHSPPGTRLR